MKQISLFMKSVHKLSISNDERHLFFVTVQAQGSAPLLFLVTVSLSLSSYSLREATCILLIRRRDVTTCITCMFSGTPPSLIDSQRVSPRLFTNGLFRETSFAAGKRLVHPRTFDFLYNSESRHLIIILLPKKKTSHHESARLYQTSKTLSNQQDSFEPARFP